jgi:hypothetical protein
MDIKTASDAGIWKPIGDYTTSFIKNKGGQIIFTIVHMIIVMKMIDGSVPYMRVYFYSR